MFTKCCILFDLLFR
uniref:Uncharacterized protein n=1 Tax=Arundo donax TaxID=35708 RepID=A0A0A9GXJ7_ARUDO